MATTRKAMRTLKSANADPDLLASLLASRSNAEATVAFEMLRYSLCERELVQLANLREVIRLLPTEPFRAGEPLELLMRIGHYEPTGHSFRRLFESAAGVYGVEFLGAEHACRGIVVHTPRGRVPLASTPRAIIAEELLPLLIDHRTLLDAILEALELLGSALAPPIYVSSSDFIAEHADAHLQAYAELFDARF